MLEFDRQWPKYGFAGHKGYGTAQHLAANCGRTAHARSTGAGFAPLRSTQRDSF